MNFHLKVRFNKNSRLMKSYHIDLSYLKNRYYNECNEIEKTCILFLEDLEKYKSDIKEDEIMEKAYETLEEISRDEKIIGLYDAEKVEQKVINTKIEGVRREGHESGLKQGMRQEKIEIAKNLLEQNVDISIIMSATCSSLEQIKKL